MLKRWHKSLLVSFLTLFILNVFCSATTRWRFFVVKVLSQALIIINSIYFNFFSANQKKEPKISKKTSINFCVWKKYYSVPQFFCPMSITRKGYDRVHPTGDKPFLKLTMFKTFSWNIQNGRRNQNGKPIKTEKSLFWAEADN